MSTQGIAILLVALRAPVALAAPLTLEALLAEVSRGAPAVQVEHETVAAAAAGVRRAGAWEDPTVGVMAEDLPLPGSMPEDHPMLVWRISQPLNLFGRRGAAKDAARAQRTGAEVRRRRVEWDARAEAAGLFFELWMNAEMGLLIDRQVAAVEAMHASAQSRYAAGLMMGHHDILRADAERAAMEAERASLADERVAMVAMLNVLRGLPPDAPLGEPVLAIRVPLPPLEGLTAQVEQTPEVAAAQAMRGEMAARLVLAEKMYLPMVMAGAQYQQNLGGMPDAWGAELAFTVPVFWWDQQRHEVDMAEAMLRRADREREAMTRMADAQVRMAWSRARAAERSLEALEGSALPRMKDAVEAGRSAYIAGSGTLLQWLEDLDAQLGLEGQRLVAIVQRERARFELSRLLGSALP